MINISYRSHQNNMIPPKIISFYKKYSLLYFRNINIQECRILYRTRKSLHENFTGIKFSKNIVLEKDIFFKNCNFKNYCCLCYLCILFISKRLIWTNLTNKKHTFEQAFNKLSLTQPWKGFILSLQSLLIIWCKAIH